MRISRKTLGSTGLPGRSASLAVSLLASLVLFLSPSPARAVFGDGSGLPDDPFLIFTAEHVRAIGADPDLWDKHFKLMQDINLADGGNEDFNMIGTAEAPFSGVFNGNGHKIANIRISRDTGESYIGMFRHIMGQEARIENVSLVNPNIEAPGGENVGALVGRLTTGTITKCHVEAGSISGKRNVGALVGLHGADDKSSPFQFTSVVSCSSNADVTGKGHNVGGLIGYMKPGTAIADCHASGNVRGENGCSDVGGLVGSDNFGSILHCSAKATVSAGSGSQNLGGLLGHYINGKIDNSYSTGAVTAGEGGKRVGGLIGHLYIGRISYCYSSGSVSAGPNSRYVGGLIGYNGAYGTLISCYTNGPVETGEGTEDLGGLIGCSALAAGYNTYGPVVNCFWDVDTSHMHKSAGGQGLTTAHMMSAEMYGLGGWGGDSNWVLDDGEDYPHLAWENKTGLVIPEMAIDRFEGEGTQDRPYVIVTADQLAFVGRASALWEKFFVLVSDLDLAGVSVFQIGVSEGTGFAGIFNGNGHVINNMGRQTDDRTVQPHGLFGYVSSGGRINNLNLRNAMIRGGDNSQNLGILADVNYGNITNCHAYGSVIAGSQSSSLGGLVGQNRGTLDSCSAVAIVTGGDQSMLIGGLVGENWGILIACRSTSRVSAGNESRSIGGLTGSNDGNNKAKIADSYSDGSITAGNNCRSLGGLVGTNFGGKIINSYAATTISPRSGSEEVGGLTGNSPDEDIFGAEITNCYFLNMSEGSGLNNGAGSPLTNDQIQHKSSFQGWDFTEIWMIYEGQDRPHLKWEQDQGKL